MMILRKGSMNYKANKEYEDSIRSTIMCVGEGLDFPAASVEVPP